MELCIVIICVLIIIIEYQFLYNWCLEMIIKYQGHK